MLNDINNKIKKKSLNHQFYYFNREYHQKIIDKIKQKTYTNEGHFSIVKFFLFIFSPKTIWAIARKIGKLGVKISTALYLKLFFANNASSSVNNFKGIVTSLDGNKRPFSFYHADKITVSIIIPVYNQISYTLTCLKSLREHVSNQVAFEVIVVNDKSTDHTTEALSQISGIHVITNETNLGFVRSCNKGAQQAQGEYVCLLNNDTIVQQNWLEELVRVISSDETIGIVGSMLIYPNGMLQEAGNIVWNDASGWNYGRHQNRFNPSYNFIREVDYVSGASLLLRKKDFDALKGLDELYVPAYYEDTDLCFAMRHQLNKKVIYCPTSQVVHFEGITSGTDLSKGVKKHQVVNKQKFFDKWKKELELHYYKNSYRDVLKASNRKKTKTILVIDSYVPCYNKESGSNRLFQILKILNKLDYNIIFLPDNGIAETPYTEELQNMGIDVLYRNINYYESINQQLYTRLNSIDIAWICRPDLFDRYYPSFKNTPNVKFLYDTIDLHFLRLKREEELFPSKKTDWERVKKMELKSAQLAHKTIAITEYDKQVLHELSINNAVVIPNIHNSKYSNNSRSFSDRNDLLFIGGYNHIPNVDAVEWLVKDIMPIVWRKIPNMKVTLLGSSPSSKVLKLANEKVIVTGFIDDVSEYFNTHKVFVAPLRYGAGMKGKIGQSLEYCLPIVSTSIGVEGMHLTDGKNISVADNTEDFASKIIELYTDEQLWLSIQGESNNALKPFSIEAIEITIHDLMESQV